MEIYESPTGNVDQLCLVTYPAWKPLEAYRWSRSDRSLYPIRSNEETYRPSTGLSAGPPRLDRGRDEAHPPEKLPQRVGFVLYRSSVAGERDGGDTQDNLIFPVCGSYRKCVDWHRVVD